MEPKIVIGIDVGSKMTKIVKSDGQRIIAKEMLPTIDFVKEKRFDEFKEKPNLVATGYGKGYFKKVVPEIHAHAKGIQILTGEKSFSFVDIGGQDYKFGKVEEGLVIDFIMNERCAAGVGRGFEHLAAALGLSIFELFEMPLSDLQLNSTCVVFLESEIVTRLAEGASFEELAGAIVRNSLEKVFSRFKHFNLSDNNFLTGGLSGLLKPYHLDYLSNIGIAISTIADGIFSGAVGCTTFTKR